MNRDGLVHLQRVAVRHVQVGGSSRAWGDQVVGLDDAVAWPTVAFDHDGFICSRRGLRISFYKVRRNIFIAVTLYLNAALGTRAAEAAGVQRCGCSSSCWCRRPTLSAFRWMAPVGHR